MKGLGPAWALLTVGSTLIGGLVGLRLRNRLTGIMAFTGGVVLGVALFDLAPESVDRLGSAAAGRTVGVAMAVGFVGFLILSRLLVLHHRDDPDEAARHRPVGTFGALALSVHSLLDGVGIGAGFALSPRVGALVLVAVVGHDFADGMNTVTFVLAQRQEVPRARAWLLIDALAPEVGALGGAAVALTAHAYAIGLAVYAGIFLMIGTGELLAEAHREPSVAKLALTAAGVLLIYAVTGLVPA
ncbi:MAG TPA: ZIP family metal transporter [Actinomycetes bacterium]|jgi:ZIP family zinc transporter|nr:ZIP family metal transporter [Actinomycetes bacterium]